MSKAIGKILGAITLVASIALAPVTGGGSLLFGTAISGTTSALILAGLAVATMVNTLLMPKAKQQARQASVVQLTIGESSREAIVGEALTGGSLVDAFNWGGKYGTDWECQVICLADHRCEGLTGFYVNDVYVPFTGDGYVSGFNNQLQVFFRDGSPGQTVPPIVLANGPGWTPSDVGTGCAWVAVCYLADKDDAKNPVWSAGRPTFAWLLKGARVYQARKDSSIGGSGNHRYNDPSTWEWTDNPIDCRYAWVRGFYSQDLVTDPSMLLVGRGLSETEAPPENVFARANLCDEMVSLDAGGSEKRYRVNGVIGADEQFITVEEWFASAVAGVIAQPEGSVEVEPGAAKSPLFFFSDDDLIVGSKVSFSDFLSDSSDEWVNTVIPRYVEPTQKFADHAAPVRRRTEDLTADGGPREQTLSLPLVTSSTQAGRCGEIARRLGRLPKRAQVTLPPDFAEVEEGDWGVWTSNRYLGGASVMFRVEAFSCDEKWQMTLTLRQIEADVYDKDFDAYSGAVAIGQETPPGVDTPSADDWALEPITVNGIPALRVFGGTTNDYLQRIEVQYRKSDGAWIDWGSVGPDATEIVITSVEGIADFQVALRYVVGGRKSDPLILGPVSTSQPVLGYLSATVFIYIRSNATPLRPDEDAEYTFADGTIVGLTGGWSIDIPEGPQALWVSRAVAYGPGPTVTIASNRWSSPAMLSQGTVSAATSLHVTAKAFSLWAYANGDVIDYSKANGELTVFSGNTDVTADATLSFEASSGVTAVLNTNLHSPITDQPKGYFELIDLTNETDTGTLTLKASYGGVQLSEVVSIVKMRGGFEIVDELPSTNLFEDRTVVFNGKLWTYTAATGWSNKVTPSQLTATLGSINPDPDWRDQSFWTLNGSSQINTMTGGGGPAFIQDAEFAGHLASMGASRVLAWHNATNVTDFANVYYVVNGGEMPMQGDGRSVTVRFKCYNPQHCSFLIGLEFFNASRLSIGGVFQTVPANSGVASYSVQGLIPPSTSFARFTMRNDMNGGNGGDWTLVAGLQAFFSIDTDLLTAGAVKTDSLFAGAVTAAKVNITQLSAISGTIGLLRTAVSGARMELADNVQKVFDGNNVLRVKIGNLDL